MGWMIVTNVGNTNCHAVYGMYMDEKDAREIHQRVGGTLMTDVEYREWAEKGNEKLERHSGDDYNFAGGE